MSYDDWKREENAMNGYQSEGYRIGMLDHIVDGLTKAVEVGYITEEEATLQLRSMLPVVAMRDARKEELDRRQKELDDERTNLFRRGEE